MIRIDTSPGLSTRISRPAVPKAAASSRNHVGLTDAPESPRTPQQYGTEGLKGALIYVPTTPRGLRLSDGRASIIDTN